MSPGDLPPELKGVLAGSAEPVFRVLPQRVLADLRRPGTESALLWNLVYPRAQPTLSLRSLLELPPLWGTRLDEAEDRLSPYYWGHGLDGDRLVGLGAVLAAVDGDGPQTEVDLFLLGERHLIAVEAKQASGLGRCSRYQTGRCPEIQLPAALACRYWEGPAARLEVLLDLGPRPTAESGPPPCNLHYQLARTLKVGTELAERLQRAFHLWLWIPRGRWLELQPEWLDFCGRVRDPGQWRRLRVLDWESIQQLPS